MPNHTRAPPPQPPLPPTPAATHRRQRTFSSSSLSSSSSSSSSLSAASSPSPSPRGRGEAVTAPASRSSKTTTTTTSVPFSWEHHPGIPKAHRAASPPAAAPLPLPPPLRAGTAPASSGAGRRGHNRRRAAIPPPCDPFAAALAECTRDRSSSSDAGLMDSLFPTALSPPAAPSGSRRWSVAASGSGGFLDLYGCKSAMAVAEGAFILRRPVAVARPGQHGRAGHHAGRPAVRAAGRR